MNEKRELLAMKDLVRYIGNETANVNYHDGQLRPVVGVHNYQVLRANREHKNWADDYGWTYNHAPMLAYWKGRFYLEYLSNPIGEHLPPGQTLLLTSEDGIHWGKPLVIFPPYPIPNGFEPGKSQAELGEGSYAVMHQRMGFYVAPNGKLLVLGFYGISPKPSIAPNRGDGIGRVVREIKEEGTFGPIYFIRFNHHAGWNEDNTRYPLYTASEDKNFKAACEALLADKLVTLQWWEEDRSPDGFYAVEGEKALSYYHLPDGRVIGLWKKSRAAISEDQGETWSPVVDVPSLVMANGKVWGQRTSDGKYALVYNPSPDGNHRWPLAITISDDGINYNNLLVVHGEVPPRRYGGHSKDLGPSYVRGIVEGNGYPLDGDLWVTYSVNKEDIWVSRIPVPIRATVDNPVDDDFSMMKTGKYVPGWNIYCPKWAEVSVVEFPTKNNKSLELRDREPYDYVKVQRVFPSSLSLTVNFKILAKQTTRGELFIEVIDHKGMIPVRLIFNNHGSIKIKHGGGLANVQNYTADTWYNIKFKIDTIAHKFWVEINGQPIKENGWSFFAPVLSVERLVFRTGPIRREPRIDTEVKGVWGEDLPGAGEPSAEAVYYLNYVTTSDHKFA